MTTELYGKTLDELYASVVELGLPKYTGKQLAEWMYQKSVPVFDEMTNIAKKNRALLQQHFTITTYTHHSIFCSKDGTKKYLFPTAQSGKYIEAVYIPDSKRNTLCVSSQTGCRYKCVFCMTGQQGLQGQLSAGEILSQVSCLPEKESLTNIVFMGMGEPFDNTDEVLKTIEILTSEYGMGMSHKRITVSTIGIHDGIVRFLENTKCHLAISLHTPFDKEREKIMPVQKLFPISKILDTVKNYKFDNHRRISFEYILFEGFNDSMQHVAELAKVLNGINCRLNLMKFHPIPGCELKSPDDDVVENFREALNKKGIIATIRKSRGMDIEAACGMLSTKKSND